MKKIINISKIIFIFAVLTTLLLYSFFLYVLPIIISSSIITTKIEEYLSKNTNIEVILDGLKLKTHYDLSANIYIKKIIINNKKEEIIESDNLNIKFLLISKEITQISADYIYIDKNSVDNLLKKRNKTTINNKLFTILPQINIKQTVIHIDNSNIKSNISLKNIETKTNKDNEKQSQYLSFEGEIHSDDLKETLKIKSSNNIIYRNNKIEIDNIEISGKDLLLKLNGNIYIDTQIYELHLIGNNLSINTIENSALYFLKQKNPNKIFLENFNNFSGLADIDLKINNKGMFGKSRIKKIGANIILFNIPVLLNDFTLYFNEKEINASAYGKIGNEKVYADFNMQNFDSKKRLIYGSVHSLLSNEFTKQYMPDFIIEGKVDTNLKYYIKNSIPEITYLLKIKKGSNLNYKNASLEITDQNRRVLVRTIKKGPKLYINSYDYSIQDGSNIKNIVKGEGLFEKVQGKMKPQYITFKTIEPTPVNFTGSFGKMLNGGMFTGDMKYDFNKKLLTGNFNLEKSNYKDFFIENAAISANEKNMIISAFGMYKNEHFESSIDMNNNFNETIIINDIEFILDKYKFENSKNINRNKIKIPTNVKEKKYTIKQGKIRVNKLSKDKIVIENIEILGELKNNIINFYTQEAKFANGTLSANGSYNIGEEISIIDFEAENIDSNEVATMVFNLPGQIEGIASAKLHAKIKSNFDEIKANASFAIKNGFLPKIGSTEFIIKRANKSKKPLKVRLSDIINIDLSKSTALKSDLNGTLKIHNSELKDVEIYTKQKYLSLFIEGNYNIEKENARIKMWGKYNKNAQKRIKILFIPLSVIMKIIFKPEPTMHIYKKQLNKIPCIQATENETEFFRVKILGNLNNNDLKVDLKSIQ